ncbi:TrbI/VirB10 family protein [Sphingosinicella microcystinivorans]|uniref:Conjugal transfer protein TrbI n=1 Tax=Sphingosinicella microcystinivorans TaxID=335406 RepID=A0AAD1D9G6_SPHMI|nr:type IV secretion system protein VirB10 [Sphingosinicella microcystinivorans]BBE36109.1 conjugal transfer protein TrbI [Sphingosinicella microcystinivorans]
MTKEDTAEAASGEATPTKTAPAKADPEALVMRAGPVRVTRFRRGVVIAVAAAGSTALASVAWFALKPRSFELPAERERPEFMANPPPDALAGAPTSYGEVPQLGEPLLGDLGRPILNRRRELEMSSQETIDEAARAAAQEAEAERQRLAAEERAARTSSVMLQLARASPTGVTALSLAGTPDGGAVSPEDGIPAPDPARGDPSGQQRKDALVGRSDNGDDINPHRLVQPASPWTLHAGSIISASLITGLNSDLPGLVTAQVTENVYDSATGRTLLIPQGSRLIGSYDSVVAFGQSRVLLVWQRIILPDGSSIRIDNVPATDTEGYAGLSDRIDRHTWQLLKGVALSTLLGVGTELGWGSGESDLVRAIRESTQQVGSRAGDELVRHSLDVQPTLRVRPGWPLRVVLHKDLILREWKGGVHG